jgi:hypothetical protein
MGAAPTSHLTRVIIGAHSIICRTNPEEDRAFLRDRVQLKAPTPRPRGWSF